MKIGKRVMVSHTDNMCVLISFIIITMTARRGIYPSLNKHIYIYRPFNHCKDQEKKNQEQYFLCKCFLSLIILQHHCFLIL